MRNLKKILIWSTSLIAVCATLLLYLTFFRINVPKSDVRLNFNERTEFSKLFTKKDLVKNTWSLKLAAWAFKMRKRSIREGSYKIDRDFSNLDFLNKLTRGEQSPVKVCIGQQETKEELAKYLATKLRCTEEEWLKAFNDEEFLKNYGLNKYNVLSIFVPNTYQVYWNISIPKFFEKMQREFDKFWTQEKIEKARDAKLSPRGVMILASMVQKEIVRDAEASIVAGVFINRLRKKMRLQSDPTVFYARKNDHQPGDDYSCMRGAKSKFNTYRYWGLPVGPICIPSVKNINAVLNYAKHDFLYFVTSRDRSFHLFSQTYQQHKKNIIYTFTKRSWEK